MELDRRNFLKGGALLGSAMALGGVVAGCSPTSSSGKSFAAGSASSLPNGTVQADFDASLVELSPITKFSEEKEYDIVVVGAGTAGVPAVLSAIEEGATVACLQRASEPLANGNGSAGIILENSTEVGVLEYMQAWRKAGGYRVNWDLLKFFCDHSGETSNWMFARSEEVGYPPYSASVTTNTYDDGSYCTAVLKSYGPKPKNHKDIMVLLADFAAKKGADFFYETPAVQLVTDKGAVKGVVGKAGKDYIKFTAKKAVIIAAGDYQNNDSLVSRYSPDVVRFKRKQVDRTGDGILMAMAAGAQMTPVNHAKTMHDMDAQPMMMTSLPFMALDEKGERFMNEDIPMASWDLSLRMRGTDVEDPGRFFRIFDNEFVAKYNAKSSIESLENYIPNFKENPYNVYPSLIDTHRADTLDELAKELDLPADALKKSVDEWNKMCDEGADTKFGLEPAKMKKIDTPPYWGTRQWIRCSAINSGVQINANCQVLDAEGKVIEGLYSVGSGAGDLCGGLEWNLAQGGLCCGSYMTQGRYAAIHAVTGGLKPSHPVSTEEVKHFWEK